MGYSERIWLWNGFGVNERQKKWKDMYSYVDPKHPWSLIKFSNLMRVNSDLMFWFSQTLCFRWNFDVDVRHLRFAAAQSLWKSKESAKAEQGGDGKRPFRAYTLYQIAYLIFVIFFTQAKFLDNKIYTGQKKSTQIYSWRSWQIWGMWSYFWAAK